MFKVRVRYCGGCNPEIDRSLTVKQLAQMLKGRAQWTYDQKAEADVILHVSGCAHACPDEENSSPVPQPVVSIQGLRVNRRSLTPEELVPAAAEKLLQAAKETQGA
ncbi:MAG: hypothetical protein K9J85_04430 [Desulfobacteraceae bacterium]|nr:hypothetical protein [Desulfobacteraceae bacterium]